MAATVVSSLVDEVSDLLRHDNLDTRVLTWVAMATQVSTRVSRLSWRRRSETSSTSEETTVAAIRGSSRTGPSPLPA